MEQPPHYSVPVPAGYTGGYPDFKMSFQVPSRVAIRWLRCVLCSLDYVKIYNLQDCLSLSKIS